MSESIGTAVIVILLSQMIVFLGIAGLILLAMKEVLEALEKEKNNPQEKETTP